MAAPAARRDSVVDRAMPIYVGLLFAVFTIVAILVLYMLRHVLLILFISILFAAALTGPSEWLHERLRVPRGLAAVLIYLLVFALLVGIGWLVVPPLLGQVAEFADKAPEYADRYRGVREAYGNLRADFPALPPFDEQISRLGSAILDRAGDRAAALPADLFSLFLDLLSVFVISLLLVTSRVRIRGFVLSLVQPTRRDEVASILDRTWSRIGVYLRAKAIVMTIVGVLMYLALLVIGVPFAVPLSIVVAFGELIPRAGPWLARIPLLAIAALDSPRTFVLTLVASVVIENLKGYVISPVVEGDQLDIHPLLVFVAVLVGASLGGAAGAFVAVPAAAIVDIVVREVVVPWRKSRLTGGTTDGTARVGRPDAGVTAGRGATGA
ncbi:MAG TPA: AI-2E family transporter [Gaiella sp.]|nr:AI-2E family transporter [Gaiella sp.]